MRRGADLALLLICFPDNKNFYTYIKLDNK